MHEETELIYSEEQKFGFWVRTPLILLMLVTIVIMVFVFIQITDQKVQGSVPVWAVILMVFSGIIIRIAVALLFWILKLRTEVGPDGLYIRFFPVHIRFKRFAAEDLGEYYARQYKPIFEYGGWGIRGSFKKGRAYNVSGNKGVQLVFKNGKRLLIGSQKAEELEEAVRSIMESS